MDVGVDTQHHRHQGGGVRATWDLSLERDRKVKQTNSVVDPNTWNLDPDPGFWPNLDPGLYVQAILKEKIQNNFREKFNFL